MKILKFILFYLLCNLFFISQLDAQIRLPVFETESSSSQVLCKDSMPTLLIDYVEIFSGQLIDYKLNYNDSSYIQFDEFKIQMNLSPKKDYEWLNLDSWVDVAKQYDDESPQNICDKDIYFRIAAVTDLEICHSNLVNLKDVNCVSKSTTPVTNSESLHLCKNKFPEFAIDSIVIESDSSVICKVFYNDSLYADYENVEILINDLQVKGDFRPMADPGVWIIEPHAQDGSLNLCGSNRFFKIVATCEKKLLGSNVVYLKDVPCTFYDNSTVEIKRKSLIDEIIFAPQPATNYVDIKNLRNQPIHSVYIRNMQGQKVKNVISDGLETTIRVDLNDLKAGIYIAEVNVENKAWYYKKIIFSPK